MIKLDMSSARFDRLQGAGEALERSDYGLAAEEAVAGLIQLSQQKDGEPWLEARLLRVLGSVERDRGNVRHAVAILDRAQHLAESVGDWATAAGCATSKIVSAQIGADRSFGVERDRWLQSAHRCIALAAAPIYRAGRAVHRAELAHRISRWYASSGHLNLAQAEFRVNVLPAALDFEDRGLLLAYLLGSIRMLVNEDPIGHASLIERYLEEADRLRAAEVHQPLRFMQHEVTWGFAHIGFGELDAAERRLSEAREILERCSFENAHYRHGLRLLDRLN